MSYIGNLLFKIFLAICIGLFTCICIYSIILKTSVDTNNNSMFITIETSTNYKIVYHAQTKVMYAVSNGASNRGAFTLLVTADGTPMVYEED